MKHTPGPWKMIKCSCGDSKCRRFRVSVAGTDRRFHKMDAQLIAAAPEMLEALNKFMLDFAAAVFKGPDSTLIRDRFQNAFEQAANAIAKARGES